MTTAEATPEEILNVTRRAIRASKERDFPKLTEELTLLSTIGWESTLEIVEIEFFRIITGLLGNEPTYDTLIKLSQRVAYELDTNLHCDLPYKIEFTIRRFYGDEELTHSMSTSELQELEIRIAGVLVGKPDKTAQ